jgi:hypothetical protein
MAFPSAPSNGQLATVNGISYTYNSTNNAWTRNVNGAILTYTAGTLPPASGNVLGNQWYNTTTDTLYEYTYDGTNYHWVDMTTPTIGAAFGNIIAAINGNTYISANLIPSSNVTYNLGSPTQRFQSLYLSGNTIDLGGATIKTDVTSGAIAFVPLPTTTNPNPVATVVSPAGTITTVVTTGGNIAAGALSTASNSASAGGNVGNLTVGNLTVSNATIHNGNIGFSATGAAPLATLDMSTRTDMMLLPVGNTAQRPSTAANGAIRYNTTTSTPEWYNGQAAAWYPFSQSLTYTVSYLIIAGAGAGGVGGGGGAGGMVSGNLSIQAGSAFPVIVGAGSASVITSGSINTSMTTGANSSALGVTALGGGSGGVIYSTAYNGDTYLGSPGGSGGGSGGNQNANSQTAPGGAGTAGQGNAGGSCPGLGSSPSGGGGGAGGAGGNGGSGTSGNGGAGLASSISGTSVTYAGGGGAGSYAAGTGTGAAGGGSGSLNTVSSTAGTANTGSGGGGSGGGGTATSGAGGSGIVIISYANPTQRATGGTVTSYTNNGTVYWVHTFTSSGTFSS